MSSNVKPPITLGGMADGFFKGVFIVTLKTIAAVLIAFPLAVIYPVLGVAEPPEPVKEVLITQEVENRIEEKAGADSNILKDGWGFVVDKTKAGVAGVGAIYDGFRDTSTREEELQGDINDLKVQIAEWKKENAKLRKELNESIVHQGVQHSRMVQCTMDLTEYLKAIPSK